MQGLTEAEGPESHRVRMLGKKRTLPFKGQLFLPPLQGAVR